MNELSKKLQFVLDNYIDGTVKVDRNTKVYQALCKDIPSMLSELLGNDKDFRVKGSMGQGNKTDYPWIAILNRNITTSTQEGLYVVFLYKRDMSGFYLSLNQGITNFEKQFKANKYKNAVKVADYFKSQLEDTTFSKNDISLLSEKNSLGFGYEKTNVISKYYPSGKFSDRMLKDDIEEIIDYYNLIVKHMDTRKYDDVIHAVLEDEEEIKVSGDEAVTSIKTAIDPDDDMPFGFFRDLEEVKPYAERSKKFTKMTFPKVGKIDYIKKTMRDAKAGLIGEELAISYERNRLEKLGREDLAAKIRWISRQSDAYGFDIESFELDKDGKEHSIKIEVKASTSKVDTEFFVSKNEVKTSEMYGEQYCVFRIYDINAEHPKFYRVFGKIEDNFILDPITYAARYKY